MNDAQFLAAMGGGLSISEWLDMLPYEYKGRALVNTRALSKTPDKLLATHAASLPLALSGAFPWEQTPEGAQYWAAVHKMVSSNE